MWGRQGKDAAGEEEGVEIRVAGVFARETEVNLMSLYNLTGLTLAVDGLLSPAAAPASGGMAESFAIFLSASISCRKRSCDE